MMNPLVLPGRHGIRESPGLRAGTERGLLERACVARDAPMTGDPVHCPLRRHAATTTHLGDLDGRRLG